MSWGVVTVMEDSGVFKDGHGGGNGPAMGRICLILAFLFIILFTVQNAFFIHLDTRPQYTDYQFLNALRYHWFLKGSLDEAQVRELHYPPLVHLLVQPFFAAMGPGHESARLGLAPYWVIFLLAMLGTGWQLGGPLGGLMTMLLAAASPHVLNCSRTFFLDFPQVSLTALSFYFLLKSDAFRDRRSSVFTGVALGVAQCAKWSAVFFMAVPALWFIGPYLFRDRRCARVVLAALGPALLAAAGLAAYYRLVSVQGGIYRPLWFLFYLTFAAGPVLLGWHLLCRLESRWKGEEGWGGSPPARVLNMLLGAGTFYALSSPWLFWGAGAVMAKLTLDTGLYRTPAQQRFIPVFLLSLFSFSWAYYAGGLTFALAPINRPRLHRLLAPAAGMAGAWLIMGILGYPLPRYYLTMIIFAAALGGLWALAPGRLPLSAAAFTLIVSIYSVISWAVPLPGVSFTVPANSFSMGPAPYLSKILITRTPARMSVEPVFAAMDLSGPDTADIFVIDLIPAGLDCTLPQEAFMAHFAMGRANGRVSMLYERGFAPGMPDGVSLFTSVRPEDGPEMPGRRIYFVILHVDGEDTGEVEESLRKRFPGFDFRRRVVDVGSGKAATVIEALCR